MKPTEEIKQLKERLDKLEAEKEKESEKKNCRKCRCARNCFKQGSFCYHPDMDKPENQDKHRYMCNFFGEMIRDCYFPEEKEEPKRDYSHGLSDMTTDELKTPEGCHVCDDAEMVEVLKIKQTRPVCGNNKSLNILANQNAKNRHLDCPLNRRKISYKREIIEYNQDDVPDDERTVIDDAHRLFKYIVCWYWRNEKLEEWEKVNPRYTFNWQENHLGKEEE